MYEQSSNHDGKKKASCGIMQNILKSVKQCFMTFICIYPSDGTIMYTGQWQILSSRAWLFLGREEER